jgi:hypothetical protein
VASGSTAALQQTHLSAAAFEQAWAVLERAQPTPREQQLFRILGLLLWSAVALTLLYFIFRSDAQAFRQLWIARAIALIYICIVPILFLNWRLVRKLWLAARVRRQLETSLRSRITAAFSARWRAHRLINLATFMLSVLGAVVGGIAALGFLSELLPDGVPLVDRLPRLTVWAVATVFGVSCILTRFIVTGRERIAAIADLRQTLLANRTDANESRLAAQDYDEITRIERAQIIADRKRSVRAAAKESLEDVYSVKEHRVFRDAKSRLDPDTLVRVQAGLDRLLADPAAVGSAGDRGDAHDALEESGQLRHAPVPGTDLLIRFNVDRQAREILVMSLDRAAGDRP